MASCHFPKDFIWGVAAASYQIEGAAYEDGKGPSVWDLFCKKEGAIKNGDTGDIACDHYHRYQEDVDIMASLQYPAYRLSVNWPRILPEGIGPINQKGLDFYDRLIDSLLEKNIAPYVTLFHWDYPVALFNKGGWLSPDSPKWFAEYTQVLVDKLSDRVSNWMTLNEPQCFTLLGHYLGTHAPGLKMQIEHLLTMIHNTFLAHGQSVSVIRQKAKLTPSVGIAMVGSTLIPHTETQDDIDAARRALFSLRGRDHGLWSAALWFDPMLLGKYPDEYFEVFKDKHPQIGPDDMKVIAQPLDFLGINLYQSMEIRKGSDGMPELMPYSRIKGMPKTHIDWPVTPRNMYWGPKFYYERYQKPIYITENGLANQDWVSLDGKVHDPQRIDFLTRYLHELNRAIADGVDVKGYFQWSVLDNFEWAEGYEKRFGLIHVDYQTQKRTVKDSAFWYSDVIKSNGQKLNFPT